MNEPIINTQLQKTVNATNGYKTKTAAFVFLLLQLLGDKIPLTPGNRIVVVNLIELLMATGLFHDLWRNREKIIEFIKTHLPFFKDKNKPIIKN